MRLDEGPSVVVHVADRIDRNFIRVLVGDRVSCGAVAGGSSVGDGLWRKWASDEG